MPKYTYKCADCDIEFEIWHSIKEKMTDCLECGIIDSLTRVPSKFTTTIQKTHNKHKVGDVVKSSIEDFRKDLKDEKKRRKSQEYKKE